MKAKKIKLEKNPIIRIYRAAAKNKKVVYIAIANRNYFYGLQKSGIVYIGTTKIGSKRVAHSAADKAEKIIDEYNCKYLDFYIISASGHPGVPIWKKLERALIIRFRELYGAVPKFNSVYKKAKWRDEKQYYPEKVIDEMLNELKAINKIEK